MRAEAARAEPRCARGRRVRLLLSMPLGLLIGLALGSVGGGGSILAVPALVYVMGLAPKPAVTGSLVVVAATAMVGAWLHWRAGRVRVAQGMWFGLAGVAGSLLGSRLNAAVSPALLLAAFSGVMVVAAWRMLASTKAHDLPRRPAWAAQMSKSAGAQQASPGIGTVEARVDAPGRLSRSTVRLCAELAGAGTVVGFMTGFFGVGGGFIIVPALVLVLGFDMPVAIGTSLLVIAFNSLVALATRVATTGVAWRIVVPFTIAGLLGVVVGGRLGHRASPSRLTRWFAVLLIVVAAYTLARSLG